MLTRRSTLLAAIAAGMTMPNRPVFATAVQPSTPVNFDVPPGACDCHTHIHGDPEKFPFFPGRVYTPEPASPEEMTALHKALRMERVVIVTPSVYGPDNSSTLFGMKARGATARGVVVIDDKTPESDLDAMYQTGVRGIRLNLATGGTNDPNVGRQRLQAGIERVKNRNWHIQMYTNLAMISAVKDLVAASPVPVVRSFRRRAGRARSGAAGLCRPHGTGAVRQGLCENLRCLSVLETGARLLRLRATRPGADRREFRPHPLGHGLAASGLGDTARPEADRSQSAVSDRRWPPAQSASGMGAGCGDPQKNPGRKSGAALRVLTW